jgi:hypothetical protein
MDKKGGLAVRFDLSWTFHEVLAHPCRYKLMDPQSTTIISVVLAIVIGYFAGRALGV